MRLRLARERKPDHGAGNSDPQAAAFALAGKAASHSWPATAAGISTRLANLMRLSALPQRAAPGFTLADQDGRRVSLSSFREKVVVLEFMDPHCTDICPIVAQEFADSGHDMGPLASKVVSPR
jgi:cytochrome oxidase Cu insertion factor (SCO1/SenC/PrrC family)